MNLNAKREDVTTGGRTHDKDPNGTDTITNNIGSDRAQDDKLDNHTTTFQVLHEERQTYDRRPSRDNYFTQQTKARARPPVYTKTDIRHYFVPSIYGKRAYREANQQH